MPSTQLPLVHCEAELHARPFAWSGWQVPSEMRHHDVATHCASVVQLVAHEVASAQT